MPAEDLLEGGEEQRGDTEVETSSQACWPLAQPSVYTPSGKEYSKVLIELESGGIYKSSAGGRGKDCCRATANAFGSGVVITH